MWQSCSINVVSKCAFCLNMLLLDITLTLYVIVVYWQSVFRLVWTHITPRARTGSSWGLWTSSYILWLSASSWAQVSHWYRVTFTLPHDYCLHASLCIGHQWDVHRCRVLWKGTMTDKKLASGLKSCKGQACHVSPRGIAGHHSVCQAAYLRYDV